VLRAAHKLKWVQALGTGVDGIIDQPSLRKDVTITNIRASTASRCRGRHPVDAGALSRLSNTVRYQDKQSWTRWPPKLLDGKTVASTASG